MDESARLVIQTDTDEILQASAQVERLQRALDAARDAVNRGAAGWELQARNIAGMTAELAKAEAQYNRMAAAQRRVLEGLAEGDAVRGGGGGRRMDAGRTSQFGFNLANTLQDAAYNPAYAVNNVMFMAQQSGGIKELGKDLKEFTVVAAAAASGGIKSLPGMIAGAGGAAVAGAAALAGLGGVLLVTNKGLKDAGLNWSDFMAVLGNTRPVKAAEETLSGFWETLSNSPAGQMIDSAWDSTKELVNEVANVTLGWDAATEAVKRHKDAASRNAADAAQATLTSGNIRGDFQTDIAGAGSLEDISGVMDRLNRAFAEGRMTEEDYAATLERVNATRSQLEKQQANRAFDLAAAETDIVAARLKADEAARKEAEATERKAQASRNAAEAAALEAEQKKNLRQYDQRVDRRADLYGGRYGGEIANAMLGAAQRGEDSGEVDARLRGQLMARMQNVAPGMREGVANEVIKRARMMAEDQATVMGFQRDVVGSALGEQAVRGDQRTLAGQMARQQAMMMGRAAGLDVEKYGAAIEKAAPGAEAAKEMNEAAKKFTTAAEMIQRVQVRI